MVSGQWSVELLTTYNSLLTTESETRNVTFIINGSPVPGTITKEHNIRQNFLGVQVGGAYWPLKQLGIGCSIGLQFPFQANITSTEKITQPTDVTFISGGNNSRPLNTSIDAANNTSVVAGLRALAPFDIGNNFLLMASVNVNASVTDMMKESGWRPVSVSLGMAVGFNIPKPQNPKSPEENPRTPESEKPTTRTRESEIPKTRLVVYDTVTIVDKYEPGRTDTVWIRRSSASASASASADTASADTASADTASADTASAVIERHLPGPAPFLSSVIRVEIPPTVADTNVRVTLYGDVIHDSQTETWVTIREDGAIIYEYIATNNEWKVVVDLDTLIDFKSANKVVLMVHAQTKSKQGLKVEALPRTITFTRGKPGSMLSTNTR